jgi:ABC-type Na+ efflux pump permease subunit
MKFQFGSGSWPVVQRELRAAARRPLGHWLRVGGAFGGVIIFCFIAAEMPLSIVGAQLFSSIHLLVLFMICGLVPALTADCIACERREGTLGLLFMTPLTASGIVLGKILAQTLRAVTLWLAVLPLLTIPFLYGGITWADVAGFFTIELCAGMICLAAGILVSSLTDNRAIAFILAFLLMGAFVAESNQFQDWWVMSTRPMLIGLYSSTWLMQSGVVFGLAGPAPSSSGAASFGFGPRLLPAGILAEDFIISAIILLAALRFAGWCVERSWQDKTPSIRRENWVKRYCSPLFARSFARSMRRTLEWNPIAWLQQYSWKARLSKWGLCLLFLVLECVVIDGSHPNDLNPLVTILLLILAAAYTYAGVNGFLQDKKSGALELILVSPLSVRQIIFGRVWGLWKQFLPSFVLLLASDIAVHVMIPGDYVFNRGFNVGDEDLYWIKGLEIVAIYLTLPIFATACALRFKNLFLASALTWLALLAPPSAGLILFVPLVEAPAACLAIVAGNIFSAGLALMLLRQNLLRRSYSF